MLYPRTGGEWTEYRAPKRVSFGHQARKRDPTVAWRVTREFLQCHCAYRLSESRIRLTAWGPGPATSAAASTAARKEATARFGASDSHRVGVREWVLDPSMLGDAIQSCVAINKQWPGQELGPLSLGFSYLLAWKSLVSEGEIEPDSLDIHDHASMLNVRIMTRPLFLQPHFVFPLAWDSPSLRSFLSEIEPDCPFRFRDQYFFRLLPSKSGDFTRVRKLPEGWREGRRPR